MTSIFQKSFLLVLRLFFPKLCFACLRNHPIEQQSICNSCQYQLKATNFHNQQDNPVIKRFWGRIQLKHAATAFVFEKDSLLQKLIHQLKYENKPEVGFELGCIYGRELREKPPYSSVDVIIPVPLHPKKQHQRGYNQAAEFARGIAETMQVDCAEDWLIRTENTSSQTQKSRLERFGNVASAFKLTSKAAAGKHILLVDDVITTGATIESCVRLLAQLSDSEISVVAIALST